MKKLLIGLFFVVFVLSNTAYAQINPADVKGFVVQIQYTIKDITVVECVFFPTQEQAFAWLNLPGEEGFSQSYPKVAPYYNENITRKVLGIYLLHAKLVIPFLEYEEPVTTTKFKKQ